MITLYGSSSPNVLKVVIALEELELPFRFEMVDVFKGDQYEPRFQALTLNGKVPVIVDDDDRGEPLALLGIGRDHAPSGGQGGRADADWPARAGHRDTVVDVADGRGRADVRAAFAFHHLCAGG